ncbi:MAG: glutaminyl-peptide cyclotransferase [Planctomycetaceae bacterium]|nr:glutaminyl-peptide cyclotransferase [Planctomycetaceae bacterium]
MTTTMVMTRSSRDKRELPTSAGGSFVSPANVFVSGKKHMPAAVLLVVATAAGFVFLQPLPSPHAAQSVPTVRPGVVKSFPHDSQSFCQGLVFYDGKLIEGTGQYKHSRLRSVSVESGIADIDVAMENEIFGEGVTVWQDKVIQLTWQNGYLLLYDAKTLERKAYLKYSDIDPTLREGWGITQDGRHLIISDGSAELRFVDPVTFRMTRKITVRNGRRSVRNLNELEFVDGQIFANIWYQDQIARIDPQSGNVVGWLDLSGFKPKSIRFNREAVLNGIAWDSNARRLFITGKHWPTLYEISVPGLNK